MSMPTATTRTTPATSSLASSAKFKTFAVTFALVGTVTYLLCLEMNWPLFTFHPATNRVAWGWEAGRSGEGPAMYWYGWTATSLIVGTLVGFLATLLPESTTKKIPLMLVWLLPILAIPYLIYDLRQWWFHP
jgi:hypothetical protein